MKNNIRKYGKRTGRAKYPIIAMAYGAFVSRFAVTNWPAERPNFPVRKGSIFCFWFSVRQRSKIYQNYIRLFRVSHIDICLSFDLDAIISDFITTKSGRFV